MHATSKSRKATISETLRKAILRSKMPYLTLEEATGVKRQSLMKFASGKQSLRLDAADRLAEYFGLVLRNP